MELFEEDLDQVKAGFPLLEEVTFQDDELFEADLQNVLGGVPYEYGKEIASSELDRMMEDTKQEETTESKQK